MSMDMENMLQSVLGNPDAMEKIMAMAQSLGAICAAIAAATAAAAASG